MTLPEQLYNAGLAPKDVERLPDSWFPATMPRVFVREACQWHPDVSWTDAAYYIAPYLVSIVYLAQQNIWCLYSARHHGSAHEEAINEVVPTAAAIPAAICRLVLRLHAAGVAPQPA